MDVVIYYSRLIGNIIASDLREITSPLYKFGSYPTLDTSRAIGENLIMTAITSSPPLAADSLGCHICWEKLWRYRNRDLLWLVAWDYNMLLILPPYHGTLWVYYHELQDFMVRSVTF